MRKSRKREAYLNAIVAVGDGGPVTAREVANGMGANVKTVAGVLKGMAESGLIEHVDDGGKYKAARYSVKGGDDAKRDDRAATPDAATDAAMESALADRIDGELRRELSLRISDTVEGWVKRNICCATTLIGDAAAGFAESASEASAIRALDSVAKAIRMMHRGRTDRPRNRVRSVVETDLSAMGVRGVEP